MNSVMEPSFIFGVEQQPASSFNMWKSLGINTVSGIPNDPKNPNTPEQNQAWVDAASAAGLWQIRPPVGKMEDDALNPWLLAWSHPDEPDLKGINPNTLLQTYESENAHGKPWFLNVSGGILLGIYPPKKMGQLEYSPFLAAADWISHDIYPVAGWDGNISLFSVAGCMATLKSWVPRKTQLCYIECSKQNLTWLPNGGRSATTFEFDCLMRQAIHNDARGVILFPQQIGGVYLNDNTVPEMKAKIAEWGDKII